MKMTRTQNQTETFMPKIVIDDEILNNANSVNFQQRHVFNVVNKWVKEYIKNKGVKVKPVHTFSSANEDTGKSNLVKTI